MTLNHLINGSVKWTKKDYALFFYLVPLVLILFFVMPSGLQSQIILKPMQPTFISAFFSNYLHTNLEHLVSNLFFYLIVLLFLFNLETEKKRFYVVAVGLLLVLPLISSLIIILVLSRIPPSLGFSAIVSGFLGYFVYAIYANVKTKYYPKLKYSFLGLFLMLNVLFWSIAWSAYELLMISSILTICVLYLNRQAIKQTMLKIKPKIKQPLKKSFPISVFISFTLAFAVLGFLILLPRNVIGPNNSIVNIFAHYVGYLVGLSLPLIYDTLFSSKKC